MAGLLLCPAPLLFGALRSHPHPSLFFSEEDLPGLSSRVKSEEGQVIVSILDSMIEKPGQGSSTGQLAAAYGIRHVLNNDASAGSMALVYAETAAAALQTQARDMSKAVLQNSSELAALAITYDLCAVDWPIERRTALGQILLEQSSRMLALGSEKGRTRLASHEIAVASAAGGLASLALSVEAGASPESAAYARSARQIVLHYLEENGDHGWLREGFGALRESLSYGMGTFLLAWRKTQGEDLVTPGCARWWAPLYATLMLPRDGGGIPDCDLPWFGLPSKTDSSAPGKRWGKTGGLGGDCSLLLCLSDAASGASLQWTFERCFGLAGDKSFNIAKPTDALFALLALHRGETSINPAAYLGRIWNDRREGIFIFRNRWAGKDDSVAGFAVNQRPLRGIHSPADAGSYRLLALGGRWAVQRQKDKNDSEVCSREKENVVLIAGTHGWQAGRLIDDSSHEDGSGSVIANMDQVYTVAPQGASPSQLDPTQDLGIRAVRAWTIDYSGVSGAPVLMIVADQIQKGPARRWVMHTAEKNVRLLGDGFEITAANGATLRATIAAPARPRLGIDRGEETQTISIVGEDDFFVIMTVQEAGVAAPVVHGKREGLSSQLSVGNCVIRFDGVGIAIR
jgi:hypothetical protein